MLKVQWPPNKWLARLGAGLALFLLLGALIPFLIPAEKFKNIVITQLTKVLGRKVTVEDARLTLLTGPGLSLKEVTIQEDPQFNQDPFLKLTLFHVRIALFPLLIGKVEVASLILDHPELQLIKSQAGRWNYESLAFLSPKGQAANTPDTKASNEQSLTISSLKLREAVVVLQDFSPPGAPRSLRQEGISLQLRNFSLAQGGRVLAQIEFPQNGGTLKLDTQLKSIQVSNPIAMLLQGELACQSLSLAALKPLLEYQGMAGGLGEGELNADVHWNSPSSLPGVEFTGQGKLANWTRNIGGAKGAKLDASFDGSFLLAPGKTQVKQLKIQLPQSTIDLTGSVQRQNKESLYSLDLKIPQANFNDILRLISLSGAGAPEGISAEGTLDGNLHIGGTSLNPAVQGKISTSPVAIHYPGINETIQLTRTDMMFAGTQFHSSPWQMSLGSTTQLKGQLSGSWGLNGSLVLEAGTPTPAPVAGLLAMGNSFGIALPAGYQLQKGLLGMQLTLQQSFQSGAAMKLQGKLSLAGCEARTPFLKVPIQIENSTMQFSGDSAEISGLAARIEQTRLTGKLLLRGFSTPKVTFQLNADQLNIGQLEQWIVTENSAPHSPSEIEGGLASPALVLWAAPASSPPSKDFLAILQVEDGLLTTSHVQYKTLVLTQLSSRLKMAHKILEMQNLTFQMYGGKHAGSATLDLNSQPPRFSFLSQLSEVSLERFFADNTKLQNLVAGTLSLNMNVKGTGSAYEEIMRNLTGGGKLQLLNGSIRSFDLMQQLSMLGRVQGLSNEGGATKIKDLISNFTIANGRVLLSDLMAHMAQTTMRANGSFGFDKTLDFKISTELPASLSQGQNWTSQIANISSATFFQNEQGRAVIPLTLRGPLDKPAIGLDSQMVQENLKKNLLGSGLQQGLKALFKPKSNNPPAAGATPPTEAAPAVPPAKKKTSWGDLLQGTLDELQKKKDNPPGGNK